MNQNEIYFTSLPDLVEGGFTEAEGLGRGWVSVEWETAEMNGIALATGYRSGAGPLALNLNLHGTYTLYVAIGTKGSLRVWVEGDEGYREFVTGHGGNGLQECQLHVVTLKGERLFIAPKDDCEAQPVHLGYIRAVPAEAPPVSARNLITTNDGWSWVAIDGIDSARDVWKFFTPLRDSDWFRMLWCPTGADFTGNHRTAVGTIAPQETTHAFRECDVVHAENFKKMMDAGIDVLAEAVKAARANDIEIHFYIRMEAFYGPYPWDHTFTSQFMLDHSELRCRDEFGDEIMRLSYAHPLVQQHMFDYMEELLQYQPDGICFAFNRGLPMMICEAPVLAEFERLHGRPASLPDEADAETMIAARTSLMTAYLERVHQFLTERGQTFSCMVYADNEVNRRYGLDLEALAAKGVFESICIHSGGQHALLGMSSAHNSSAWQRLRDSRNVKLYPGGFCDSWDYQDIARFLRDEILGQAFAGGFFWDVENYTANPYNWLPLRRGGTPEVLNAIINGEIATPRISPHTRIRGVKLGRYTPANSY